MNINKKFFLGFSIVLLLVIGWYLSKNSETTINQETLKNQELKEEKQSTQSANVFKQCDGAQTPSLTEGPYYKSGSPKISNLREVGIPGEKLTLTGFVYDVNCKSIANAWIDFWQADGEGEYDNSGFKLRGHRFTDNNGKYVLDTYTPGEYPGRTPHIHIKLRATENSPIVTTQLFLPGKDTNQSDSIYDDKLLMQNVLDTPDGKTANFDFVIHK